MKKIAILLLLIILLTCPSVAHAEGTKWVRIVRNDTYLYATEDCSKQLFALEESYYAEILQELDKTYFVKVDTGDKSFPNLCGYVLKNEVRVQENAPDNPLYPTEKLVVKSSSAMLKLSPYTFGGNTDCGIQHAKNLLLRQGGWIWRKLVLRLLCGGVWLRACK